MICSDPSCRCSGLEDSCPVKRSFGRKPGSCWCHYSALRDPAPRQLPATPEGLRVQRPTTSSYTFLQNHVFSIDRMLGPLQRVVLMPAQGLPGFALIILSCLLRRRIPVRDLALRFFFGDAVSLLDLAYEALMLAGDHVEIVIGQLAPLLANRSLHLSPLALNLFRVHYENCLLGWFRLFKKHLAQSQNVAWFEPTPERALIVSGRFCTSRNKNLRRVGQSDFKSFEC